MMPNKVMPDIIKGAAAHTGADKAAEIRKLEVDIMLDQKSESKLAHDLGNLADLMEAGIEGRQLSQVRREYATTAVAMFDVTVIRLKKSIRLRELKGLPPEPALEQQMKVAQSSSDRLSNKITNKVLGGKRPRKK